MQPAGQRGGGGRGSQDWCCVGCSERVGSPDLPRQAVEAQFCQHLASGGFQLLGTGNQRGLF